MNCEHSFNTNGRCPHCNKHYTEIIKELQQNKMKCILNNTELKDDICNVCSKGVIVCLRELKADNVLLDTCCKDYKEQNEWLKKLLAFAEDVLYLHGSMSKGYKKYKKGLK